MSNPPLQINSLPLIGIPVDVKTVEGKPFHTVGEKYIHAVAVGSNAFPLLIPAKTSNDSPVDLASMIDQFDGIFLPGSISNVHPEHYGQTPEYPELLTDQQRDESTFELINLAVQKGIPILGACRGFQEMNVAFGGSLYQQVHEQEAYFDHREDQEKSTEEQYAYAHEVNLTPDGILESLLGKSHCQVNSLHGQGIKELGDGLKIEAVAPDGLIEAFSIETAQAFSLAVQWHPEWRFSEDPLSKSIFNAFGDAARLRKQQKQQNTDVQGQANVK